MGKTLIIKGANFEANSLARVVFNDKPCTSLTLDDTSYTLDGVDEVTVVVTKIPADTTDDVLLSVSDNSIVSISGTTLKAIGIGSCTLTVVCGNQKATATVTVSKINKVFDTRIESYRGGNASWSGDTSPIVISSNSSYDSLVMNRDASSGKADMMYLSGTGDCDYSVMKIPENASQLTIIGSGVGYQVELYFTSIASPYSNVYASYVQRNIVVDEDSDGKIIVSIPTNADSFMMSVAHSDNRTYSFAFS